MCSQLTHPASGCLPLPLAPTFLPMHFSRQNQAGFTLIELTVVVLMLSILAAIALPTYASMIRRSQYAKTRNQMGVISRQVQMYRVENGQYPNDVDPQQPPEAIGNWPTEVPLDGYYDYDHWSVEDGQCYVQIGYVGEGLERKYEMYEVNAQPNTFEEIDDNLVLGIDLYECSTQGKKPIR